MASSEVAEQGGLAGVHNGDEMNETTNTHDRLRFRWRSLPHWYAMLGALYLQDQKVDAS